MNLTKINLILLSLGLLSGCNQISNTEATISAEQVLTAVAETVAYHLSQTPAATSTHTPTKTPTATYTETLTATPSPSSSPTDAAVTGIGSQSSTCESAAFISDVTIPDGTQFTSGAAFTKTWRLKNNGSCPWTTEFSLSFSSGNAMSGNSPQKLKANVAPGYTTDISISLVTPTQAGSYTGYWRLKNAAGASFGDTFYVEIKVSGSGTTTVSPTMTVTGMPTATETPVPPPTSTVEPTETETEVPTETPIP